jgi:hypothetical protein
MGYRSEVAVVIKKEVYETFVNGLSEEDKKNIGELLQDAEKHENEYAVLLRWQDIKWYLDYNDVGAFMKSLENLDEDDYLFVRIGDDMDDTQTCGYWWDNTFDVSINRSIYFSR